MTSMRISVKYIGWMKRYNRDREETVLEIPEGSMVRSILTLIPAEEIGPVLVNGKKSPMETPLSEGDAVTVYPAIVGG